MATYAVGDLQGCYQEFRGLLEKINFGPSDKLLLAGDLVNRGPHSLETLRFIRGFSDQCEIVLGNHDLHLLAIVIGGHGTQNSDTFDSLLESDEIQELVDWLLRQRLMFIEEELNVAMVHAGIYPEWDLKTARELASEVELVFRGQGEISPRALFKNLYGNEPRTWSDDLRGIERLRFIINCFTRMRMLTKNATLNFDYKGPLEESPNDLIPWFRYDSFNKTRDTKILFGHWASLEGKTGDNDFIALDTGCVWGRRLTAYCLETGEFYFQEARRQSVT